MTIQDEISVRRAKRQNALTAPAVTQSRWEDVGAALNQLVDDWEPRGVMRPHAYQTFLGCDTQILAALLCLAVERLAER